MPSQPPHAVLPISVVTASITSTKRSSTFNYYGPVQFTLTTALEKFFACATAGDADEAASAITTFIQATQEDCVGNAEQKAAFWLTIRVTKPSTAFCTPRWHQDGLMFPYDKGRENVIRSKYALTLLGPITLILEPDTCVFRTYLRELHLMRREIRNAQGSQEDSDRAVAKLQHLLAFEFEDAVRVQIGNGNVVRFSWGCKDSPVHSEPDHVSDRVFVSVLYGSEAELRGMCQWRGTEYGKPNW